MTVRVGFLGAGLIATYHSKSLRHSGADVAWAGVYDPDGERAAAFAAASGATVCDTEDEVLDGCDAVYVCTWTSEHRRLVEAACRRGVAVFCEKPLAFDGEAARAMTELVDRSGVVNQVGLVMRYAPVYSLLKDLIAEPASGRLMNVVYRDDQYIPTQGMYRSTWRGELDKVGAGALLEHSIHDIDMIEYVCGPVSSLSARSANFHGIDGIEDSVVVSMAFAGGGLGVLASVWHDILERPSLRRVEVFCERLYATLEEDWFGPLRWTRPGEPTQELGGDELVAEVERRGLVSENPDGAFVRAVAAGGRAWPSFGDAVRPHDLVDAPYRSAAVGEDIDVADRSAAPTGAS